jgi:hypothetical protein
VKLTACPWVLVAGKSQQAIGFFIQLVKARVTANTMQKNLMFVFIVFGFSYWFIVLFIVL